MEFDGIGLQETGQKLLARLMLDQTDCSAMIDISLIAQMLKNTENGLMLQEQALRLNRLYQAPPKQNPPRLRLLGFAAPGCINANTPIEFLIEDSDIALYICYLTPGKPAPPLPEHDLVITLIGESEAASSGRDR